MKPEVPSVPSWLLWGTALLLVFAGLGSVPLLNNNEGLYAEIPREMLASGDWRAWIIPHLNGLPYMEKPPLLYWLTALSFALFGTGEIAARLVPALSALACVGMLVRFGRLAGHAAAGRLAALVFISGIGVLAMARVLMFDMLLTALLAAALFNTWLYLEQGRRARLCWAYAALALAVLTKGLVALVLFGMVTLAAVAMTGGGFALRRLRALFDPLALAVFAALVLPWHLAASLVEPAFAQFYFYNEHVLRFLGRRLPQDYYGGPWWYYLPRMAIYLFPWVLLLLLRMAPADPQDDSKRLRRFLLLGWLLPLLFFSVSRAKANYYLVAVMPFAAMHLALLLDSRDWRNSRARLLPPLALVLACALLAVVGAKAKLQQKFSVFGMDEHTVLLALFGGAALLAAGGLWVCWKQPRALAAALLVPAAWIAAGLGLVLPQLEAQLSSRPVARELQQHYPQHRVVLAYEFEKQSSLPFYLGQPLTMVESVSADLFWGNQLRPGNALMWNRERFLDHAAREKIAVVVTDEYRANFESWKGGQFRPVFRSGHATVYVNP